MLRVPVLAVPAFLAFATLASATLVPGAARAQDAAAGQRIFGQCRVCHILDATERNGGVGPNLYNVVGRKAAERPTFRYSANMRQLAEGGLTWTEENLRAYLANPKAVVPQGSMAFAGLRQEQQITDVIAYLRSAPTAAPAGAAPAAATPAAPAAPAPG